jgi:hypothetical protein
MFLIGSRSVAISGSPCGDREWQSHRPASPHIPSRCTAISAIVIDGRDRERVERRVRYITRPALSQERLERLQDGRVQLTLKSTWRDGTPRLRLRTLRSARLCAAVPPPRFHMLRYHGVLAAHCKLRSAVTPQPPKSEHPMNRSGKVQPAGAFHGGRRSSRSEERPKGAVKAPAWGDQKELFEPAPDPNQPAPYRKPWSWLLRHVFLKDVSHCPRCGGPMRWVEGATSKEAISRLMAEHGEGPAPGPRPAPIPPDTTRAAGVQVPPLTLSPPLEWLVSSTRLGFVSAGNR